MRRSPVPKCETGPEKRHSLPRLRALAGVHDMGFSRRSLLLGSTAALTLPALGKLGAVHAQTEAQPAWKHGLSLFGEIKYPPNFPHFEYVNPKAPQGGVVREIAFGTFDNFNAVI